MRAKENSAVVHKFILYKIKKLVCDSRGRAAFINNFDNVIYEIFGVEHFSKKLNHVYSNRDFVAVLDKVGVEYLLELTNNSKLYNIMHDLVEIDARIIELRKQIRKSGKKNKRDKSLIKEFNYLTDIYKDSIKLMRKRFGIKNSRTAYKRRYHAVNDLLSESDYDYDDEFTSILMRDDDFFFGMDDDDDDDYEYDDYESSSELEDFVRRMNGSSRGASNRGRSSRSRDYVDFDDDDDDEFETIPRRKYVSPDEYGNDRLSKQVDSLSDTVELLASSVQSMMNEREYAQTTSRRVPLDDSNDSVEKALDAIHAELSAMQSNNKVIAHALDNVLQRQDDLTGVIGEMINDFVEDDGEESDVIYGTPQIVDSPVDINKYPDVNELPPVSEIMKMSAELDRMSPTREELIDLINQSGNVQQQTQEPEIEVKETEVQVTESTTVAVKETSNE